MAALDQRSVEALTSLSSSDQKLLGPMTRLAQLIRLHEGARTPVTQAQAHFARVARGDLKAETDFEFAYLRFLNAIAILFDKKNKRTRVVPSGHTPQYVSRRKARADDIDKFGIPYEEGVPRPGWKPLGRLQ